MTWNPDLLDRRWWSELADEELRRRLVARGVRLDDAEELVRLRDEDDAAEFIDQAMEG